MQRSLLGHAGFAVVAVGAAYFAWTAPKASSSNLITMVDGSPERLIAISWHEEKWDVTVTRAGDEVEVTQTSLAPAADKASESEKAAEPANAAEPDKAQVSEPKTFPGTKTAKELFTKLAPLQAARSLGAADPERLKNLGLSEPSAKLSLRFGAEERVVEIGDSTYGTGDLYARYGGELYLLSAVTLGTIRHGATSLIDRALCGDTEEKLDHLTVSGGGRDRELVKRHSEENEKEKEKAFFAAPADPNAKLELVTNWMDRVLKLRMADFATDMPAGAPALEIEMFNAASRSLGVLKIWQPGEKSALAVSSRFKKPITISKANAEAILKDLEAVLSEGT